VLANVARGLNAGEYVVNRVCGERTYSNESDMWESLGHFDVQVIL